MISSLRRLFTSAAILAAGLLPHFSPSAHAAEIQVLGNSLEIVDGDSTPRTEDFTFFGVQTVGAGNLTRTFTIKNLSTLFDVLFLTGTPLVSIGGANPGDFVVTTPPVASLFGDASITFTVTWTPTFGGIHNATLSIANNDSNENPYNFAIQATAQVKLTYVLDTIPNGTLSGTTSQLVFYSGSGTAVTAVPAAGYHFVNWSDASTANPRTDTNVTQNLTVKAYFATGGYTLAYTAGANGSLTGTRPQTVSHGTSGSAVTAVPATGYRFVNWSDSSTANPRTDTNVTANKSVTANFAINTYTLTYAAGANGSLTGTTPQTVNYNASGSPVTAAPAIGYSFVNWSDGSTANPRTDTNVTATKSVTATFAINTYTLTYAAGDNGSLTGTTPQTVNYNASGTAVTAIPATGYRFVNWSDSSTTNPRIDTDVTANKSVTANFAAGYTLTAAAGANNPAPVDTTNPSLVLNWMICRAGVFPSRDGGGAVSSADDPYLGEIRCVTFDSLTDFLPCDGRLLPIRQNTALFALLGTSFGGDGRTTFAIPDLRGRVPVGVSPGNAQYELGVAGGQESVTLNSSQLPSHSHSITVAPNSTGATGASQAFSNQQPYLALNICMQGGGSFNSIGWIHVFPYDFTPAGFYPSTGGVEQIGANQTLFAQIGTTFGGNGIDTFGLPDLRGRALVGTGLGAGLTSRQIGESNGASSLTLTASQLPSHSHALAVGTTGTSGSDTALNKTQASLALKAMIAMQGYYGAIGFEPALGEVRFLAQTSTATGFVNCDGALKSINQNQALFSLFGTTFGGDGRANFGLPDLQGRRPVSTGQGLGLTNRAIGERWGEETITLTTAQMPAHTHTAPAPTAPTNVVATAGNGQASLTFTTPSENGGSAITGYIATSNPGGITGTSAGAATAITVTGLANGTAYTFTVAASNATGTSLTTGTSNSVITPYTLTYTAGTNGTLSGNTTQLVSSSGSGSGTAVTAVPTTGFHFVNWSDGSTANPRTDTNVTADLSVTANFLVDAPVINVLSPATGPTTGGTSVTISGANLLNASSVTFGGTAATIVSTSHTSVIVTSPAHAGGAVNVVVTTPGGSSNVVTFTYDAPILTSIAPARGPTTGGTSVTISGANLLNASSVTFGGTAATIVSTSHTSITATSPAHAGGAVNVVVTTSGGSSNVVTFTYDAPANTIDTWRSAWYGPGATNTGNAANTADPYRTGVPNILVYAFIGSNQNPATAQISQLPQATASTGFLTYQFTEPAGVSGLTYGAEWSATLGATGSWQPVTDTGTAPGEHRFRVPMDTAAKFLRLTVTPSP